MSATLPPARGAPKPSLEQLLRREDLWRGHSSIFTHKEGIATGFAALDRKLAGKGWPGGTLIELCLAEAYRQQACGGEWILLAPTIKQLCVNDAYTVLLNPPAQPFAAGLIQLGLPLNQLLIVQAASKPDFVASFIEFSRSQHCGALLAWQPKQALSYTELRKCQLACAEGKGLYFLSRSHWNTKQNSPAALRLQLTWQTHSLQIRIFKQKAYMQVSEIAIDLPGSFMSQPAHNILGSPGQHTTPLQHDLY